MPGGFHTFQTAEVLTAANVNTYLMQQAVIQCTSATRPSSPGAGMTSYETDLNVKLVYDGTAWVTETWLAAVVVTSQTTSSVSFTDLATAGPSVSVQTNTSALVTVGCQISNATGNDVSYMGYAISGATTLAASQAAAFFYQSYTAGGGLQGAFTSIVTGLTAGANTFTAKYQVSASTGTFVNRNIAVVGLP